MWHGGCKIRHQSLDERLAKHIQHVELGEGGIVVVERGEKEDVLSPNFVFRIEAA